MDFIRLNWDSQFFGFEVCKINEEIIYSKNKLTEVLQEAKLRSYRLCYLIISAENYKINDIAKFNNGLLVDEKVTYSIRGIDNINLLELNNVFEYTDRFSVDELYDLAIQSSHQSRFRIDKNFENNICDDMYKIWVNKSISGDLADKIFIYSKNGSIDGFITLNILKNTGKIILIGVNVNMRGGNLGKKLIHKSFEYFTENGIFGVDVDTQKRNIGACRFYEKCGFEISKLLNIYHFWL